MSIGEHLTVKRRIWRDQVNAVRRYYKSPRFALLDLSFGLFSLFSNPYRTCRKFLEKKGERDIYAYGETPFTTLQQIAAACQLQPQDRWIELGAGRGKGCFWIAHFIGCETIGIEWIPQFVRAARFLKACFKIKNVSFHLQNMEEADFTTASVVYLYGTCLEKERVRLIVDKMKTLPKGAKVISISYPLESDALILKKTFDVQYPWGDTEAFLHEKI